MKILIVLPRFPYPLEKGDKLRAFNQIKTLAKRNAVYLFCISHDKVNETDLAAVQPYCKEICIVRPPRLVSAWHVVKNLFSTRSLQVGYWTSRRALQSYKAFEATVDPDVLYVQMVRMLPLASHSKYPKVLDFQDALSMNMERRMAATPRGLRRFAYHYEFKMLRSLEYKAFDIFDALTIISEPDCNAIPHKRNEEIHIVPNGVDLDYFSPRPEADKRFDIVFCGNMQYEPNVQAALYLAQEVMPLVWRDMPQAKLLLGGATPTRAVRNLASERIEVSGTVPDIRDCYASATVFAAPMRTGSGLQNKLLEAMSMGIPCVTSSIANDALGAQPEVEILVGDTARDVADHIVDLLKSEQQRLTLAANAQTFVREHFSWQAYGERLEQILFKASNKRI
ncbi:MAG: glycosyltransferase [Bacteroidales bacterium]|nr:glycosyltransferase [Bacteroidales bacterium]